jgi:hypothetical protein
MKIDAAVFVNEVRDAVTAAMAQMPKDGASDEQIAAVIAAGISTAVCSLYTKTLQPLVDQVTEVAPSLSDVGIKRIQRMLDDHKEEVRKMLERHNTDRAALRSEVDSAIKGVDARMTQLQQGLNRAEGRLMGFWNAFNTFVRFYEGEMGGRWEEHKQSLSCEVIRNAGHPGEAPCGAPAIGKTKEGTCVCIDCYDDDALAVHIYIGPRLIREKFLELYKLCGAEVFNEAMAHEQAELARLKDAKAKTGQRLVMQPPPKTLADNLVGTTGEVVRREMPKHSASIKELHDLRNAPPGRNDPCPCGSGKKYKKCHWLETEEGKVSPPGDTDRED